jgi:predicted transcriptional regulator
LSKQKRARGGRPPLLDSRLERVTFSLDPETIKKLEQVAKAQERSSSFVAREAIKRYLATEAVAAA